MSKTPANEPAWLAWAKKLNSIAQAGLSFSHSDYDRDRYEQIREISIDILSTYTEIDHAKIKDLFANETGYLTPKVDVRAAVFRDDAILMIREKADGKWSLPGGWADIDGSIRENLIKECREEAGIRVEPRRIIAILDRKKHHGPPLPYGVYKVFAECEYISGDFQANTETLESGFFTQENIPPLSKVRITMEQIEMCFTSRSKPGLEAFFD